MATVNVKEYLGGSVPIEKPNANGRQAASGSRPVALATDDSTNLATIATAALDTTTPVPVKIDQTTPGTTNKVSIGTDGAVIANIGTSGSLATAAKQPALGTAGAASTDVITVQGIAGGTAQPVSAASLPLPSGAATSALQDDTYAPITPATATAVNSILLGGQYLSTLATFTNGQQGAAALDTRGAIHVNIFGADGTSTAAIAATNSDASTPSATQNQLATVSKLQILGASNFERMRTAIGAIGAAGVGVLGTEEIGRPFSHIATNTTTTVKSGAGHLHSISINTKGLTNTATVYDNTAGSGTVIGILDTTIGVSTLMYDLAFATGLTIVTAGGTSADLTITYR